MRVQAERALGRMDAARDAAPDRDFDALREDARYARVDAQLRRRGPP
jgi:hypothetical protein